MTPVEKLLVGTIWGLIQVILIMLLMFVFMHGAEWVAKKLHPTPPMERTPTEFTKKSDAEFKALIWKEKFTYIRGSLDHSKQMLKDFMRHLDKYALIYAHRGRTTVILWSALSILGIVPILLLTRRIEPWYWARRCWQST